MFLIAAQQLTNRNNKAFQKKSQKTLYGTQHILQDVLCCRTVAVERRA